MNEKSAAVIIGVCPEKSLGAALAKYFAMQGLHVFVAGRSENKLRLVNCRKN